MKAKAIKYILVFIVSYSTVLSCTSDNSDENDYEYLDRPTIESVEIEDNTIVLTWSKVKGANGYEIFHSDDGVNYKLVEAEYIDNRYIDTNPVEGTNYYKVRATSNKIKSEFSNPSSPVVFKKQIIFKNDIEKIEVCGVSFNMIKVKGGSFNMGIDDDPYEGFEKNASPMHKVILSDYYIGETEVTQELYQAIIGRNPSYFHGNQKPVETVTWYDCQKFITILNEQTGLKFRLPTEAEWEYAASGGHKKPAGDSEYDIKAIAWSSYNSGKTTHNVATRAPNALACYDFIGNVYEWCQDWDAPYTSETQTNPKGPSTGEMRIYRGGSYICIGKWLKIYRRRCSSPYHADNDLGFRLAL